jgi:hypothetical protein
MWHRHALQLHRDEMLDDMNDRPPLVAMPGTLKRSAMTLRECLTWEKRVLLVHPSEPHSTAAAAQAHQCPQHFSVLQASLALQSAKNVTAN